MESEFEYQELDFVDDREEEDAFAFVRYQELQQPFNQESVIRIEEGQILHVWRGGRQNGLVTISYNDPANRRWNQMVTLIVTPQTVIQNTANRPVRLDDLQPGMRINAIFSSRMSRSMPPQALAFLIVVLDRRDRTETAEGRITDINRRDNTFEIRQRRDGRDDRDDRGRDDRGRDDRDDNRIRFRVTNQTQIFDRRGRRIRFEDLRRDDRVRVEFTTEQGSGRQRRNIAIRIQVL